MKTTKIPTEAPSLSLYPAEEGFTPETHIDVGGTLLLGEPVIYNADRATRKIVVRNRGDRPIQVGSHFHFFEVNRYLEFDRDATFGTHLNIPATTAIRFEPGDEKQVEVVAFGGKRRIVGFNALTEGYAGDEAAPAYLPTRHKALRRMRSRGFMDSAVTTEFSATSTPQSTSASTFGAKSKVELKTK